jgi:7-cyano-7-deazaguanine reductase
VEFARGSVRVSVEAAVTSEGDFNRFGSRVNPEDAMPTRPNRRLQSFPNPQPARDYRVHMEIPEFTCLCPKTGQPDFATLSLDYIPDQRCVELKSLKLYIWSYRDRGAFHEAVTNQILDDLVAAIAPRYMRLEARFYVRGGIFTTVVAEHRSPGWSAPAPVALDAIASQPSVRTG